MNKKEGQKIAWSIIYQMPNDSESLPDPNNLVRAIRDVIKENPKVLDGFFDYDNGFDILCGFIGREEAEVEADKRDER